MKKIFITALSMFMAVSAANAKTASELRFYLNAGHGSWGPNDRPMATIPYPNLSDTGMPDTCGFYESNTNLWKVLKLGAKLESVGVKHENILYSRVKNGPFPYVKGGEDAEKYNRSLSEICTEVESNNIDMFFSVHSNAASEGSNTNYPLFIYRGKDGDGNDYAPGSRNMGVTMWPLFYTNEIDPQSYYSPTSLNVRGDVSFYGSESTRTDPNSGVAYSGYLGVLKHGAPGFLTEGYFHTYQPARHRALNKDYCGQEGVRYLRGIMEYFKIDAEKTGYIMGTVKDEHEKISNTLFHYMPNTNDQWLPINGASVKLYKGDTEVATYTVDNNYNGVFVFENLAPGEYTLKCSAEGYKAMADDAVEKIVVKANETSYATVYLESESYEPPKVVYTNYPDPKQPSYAALPNKFNMKVAYLNSAADVLDNKTVNRAILRGDSLYVLAHDTDNKPYIYLINPENSEGAPATNAPAKANVMIKQIPTTGTQGSISALADIAFTADGYLIGCNEGLNQYSDDQVDAGCVRGYFRAYKWAKDENGAPEGDPTEWFNSTLSGNYYRANTGHTLAVSGASNDCKVVSTAVTTGSAKGIRFLEFNVVDDAVASQTYFKAPSSITELTMGEDFKLMVSPRDDNQYVLDGKLSAPIELHNAGSAAEAPVVGKMDAEAVNVASNGANYFKYAKRAMMSVPECNAEGKLVGVKLYDITDGLDKAVLVNTTNTTIDAVDNNGLMAAGLVNGLDLSLYLMNGTKLSKFTTEGVEQPKPVAIYAYNLNMTDNTDSYEFTFDANTDATRAYLAIIDATSGETLNEIEIPNVVTGANKYTLSKSELTATPANWGIHLYGDPVTAINVVNTPSNYSYTRARGMVVNSLPETDHFGEIYVADNKAKKLYVYNPDGTEKATATGGTGRFTSTGRMAMMPSGKPCIAEWGDPYSGIWVVDPDNLSADFPNFYDYATKDANGNLFNAANEKIGSSTPGVYFLGSGEDTKLYAYLEDFGNNVAVYNIGTAESWNKVPDQIFNISKYQANTNGNVIADATGGCWVSQVRSSGNNDSNVPSLIYVNKDGEVTFNSGSIADDLSGSVNGGYAISPDGNQLVIADASNQLCVFDINWTAEGTPTLALKYAVPCDNQPYQMSWDYAGNLYLANTKLTKVSFPKAENDALTPAKKTMLISGSASGITDNVADQVKVSIYPNPTTSNITVKTNEEIVSVKVYSTTGALVAESKDANVDLSDLSAGMYIVKVNDFKAVQVIKK